MYLLISELAAIDILPVPGPSQLVLDVDAIDRGDMVVYREYFDSLVIEHRYGCGQECGRACFCHLD